MGYVQVPPCAMFSSIMGETRPMTKLLIQVVDVVSDVPVDRVAKLKISAGKTHPRGPHEYEKLTS